MGPYGPSRPLDWTSGVGARGEATLGSCLRKEARWDLVRGSHMRAEGTGGVTDDFQASAGRVQPQTPPFNVCKYDLKITLSKYDILLS